MQRYCVLRYYSPEEPCAPQTETLASGQWPYHSAYIDVADLLQTITQNVLPKKIVWGFSGSQANAAFVLGTYSENSYFSREGKSITRRMEAAALEHLNHTVPGNNGQGPLYTYQLTGNKPLAILPLNLISMRKAFANFLLQELVHHPRRNVPRHTLDLITRIINERHHR